MKAFSEFPESFIISERQLNDETLFARGALNALSNASSSQKICIIQDLSSLIGSNPHALLFLLSDGDIAPSDIAIPDPRLLA